MIYWPVANKILKWVYPSCTWEIPAKEKIIYITFDDGPHPEITPWVLDQLAQYNAKASFFCIGKNVELFPEVFERIKNEGHSLGNHTMNHLNGWKVEFTDYLKNIQAASSVIPSRLFRPPYGKITRKQIYAVRKQGYEILMWSVLSADFDVNKTAKECWKIIDSNIFPGAIIVFHDSEKAFVRLRELLPEFLNKYSERGYRFERIVENKG